jgi:hydrogenase maturation protease
MKVLIGGIGNVLLGDDGVGPYVVRFLSSRYQFAEGVEIVDVGTPALDLIDQLSGKDAVILVDSIKSDTAPGTVQLYNKDEIVRHRPEVRMDPHSPALVETLLSADFWGMSPPSLLLVGIVGENYEPNCGLTHSVNRAVPTAVDKVLAELERLGVPYQQRRHPLNPDIWWSEAGLLVEQDSRSRW